MPDPCDPVERALFAVHESVADFLLAVQRAETSGRAQTIVRRIAEARGAIQAVEVTAEHRADRLMGEGR